MASDAKPHRVVHFSFGYSLLPHIAMANRAIDPRPNMWGMIELYMSGGLEAVDALPGHVLTSRSVRREFLDFRFICGDHLMAGHAEIDARNPRIGPLIDADVTLRALHAVRQMHFVRVGDWLHGLGANSKKFADRVEDSGMRRREKFRIRFLGSGRLLSRRCSFEYRQSQSGRSDCNYDEKIMAQAKRRPRQSILFMIENNADREADIVPLRFGGVNGIYRDHRSSNRRQISRAIA